MDLRLIPSGEYLMGAPETDDLAQPDEHPQHRVRTADRSAWERTVTAQFRAVTDWITTAAEVDGKGASGYDPAIRGFEYERSVPAESGPSARRSSTPS
jgi:hypothetical protein